MRALLSEGDEGARRVERSETVPKKKEKEVGRYREKVVDFSVVWIGVPTVHEQ